MIAVGIATYIAGVSAPVATLLGTYNLARFVSQKGLKGKRKAEGLAKLAHDAATAVKYAKEGVSFLKSKDVSKEDVALLLQKAADKLKQADPETTE